MSAAPRLLVCRVNFFWGFAYTYARRQPYGRRRPTDRPTDRPINRWTDDITMPRERQESDGRDRLDSARGDGGGAARERCGGDENRGAGPPRSVQLSSPVEGLTCDCRQRVDTGGGGTGNFILFFSWSWWARWGGEGGGGGE